MEIRNTPLSARAINALSKAGYTNLSDCENMSFTDLCRIQNLGRKTAQEIVDFLRLPKSKGITIENNQNHSHEDKLDRHYLQMVLAVNMSDVGWSVRASGALDKARVKSLADLVVMTPRELMKLRNFGKKTLAEIKDVLKELDLRLGMKIPNSLLQQTQQNTKSKILDAFLADYPEKKSFFVQAKTRTVAEDRIEFYKSCYELYKSEGTLQAVAIKKKLTRERIRQILVKGTNLGLFKYSGHEYPFVAKEKILSDYQVKPSLGAVAKGSGVSTTYLKQLLTAYRISEKQLLEIKDKSKKEYCIQQYRLIESELGHHPTTTEMQKRSLWRSLHARIGRLWGSIDKFRHQLSIPNPIRRLPELSRQAFEKRRRLAFIVRIQNLDQIRDFLQSNGTQSSTEIAYECRMKSPKVLRLLGLLMANSEIIDERQLE